MTTGRTPNRRPPIGMPEVRTSRQVAITRMSRSSWPTGARAPVRAPGAAPTGLAGSTNACSNGTGSHRTGRGGAAARTARSRSTSAAPPSDRAAEHSASTSAHACSRGSTRSQTARTADTSAWTPATEPAGTVPVVPGGRSTSTTAPASSTRTSSTRAVPSSSAPASARSATSSRGTVSVTATPTVGVPIRSSASGSGRPTDPAARATSAPVSSRPTSATPTRWSCVTAHRSASHAAKSGASTVLRQQRSSCSHGSMATSVAEARRASRPDDQHCGQPVFAHSLGGTVCDLRARPYP